MRQTMTTYLDLTRILNANDRRHWTRRAGLTRGIRAQSAQMARVRLQPVTTRQHVVITFGFTTKRRRDVANLAPTAKAIVDGITDAKVWPDDNDDWIVGPDLRTGPLSDRAHALRIDISLEDA